jgi:cytochrome P450
MNVPPGPSQPSIVQTIGWWTRPVAFVERCRRRFGRRFTIRLLATPPFVMHADPAHVKEIFTAPPEVLHPGEGARILEPVVGKSSVILLDEGDHLSQRRLMLPAFHGEKMERLTGLMAEVSDREVASWPQGEPFELHPRFQALTLEIILRAVFGLDAGERLEALRTRLTEILALGSRPVGMFPFLQREIGGISPWRRFLRLREETDELIFELISDRRGDLQDRDDVLSMLLGARHEDGSSMSPQELRDELMTLLVAGHETTASELAWAFEQLVREPRVLARLTDEIDGGTADDYLVATIHETLRRRPVLPNAAPRLVKQEVEIGGWTYAPGVCLVASSYLIHHDHEIYADPYAFRPERFLEAPPGTYTWIPFGGGRRRCLGASFAQVEMKIVLRSVLAARQVRGGAGRLELTRRRSITVSPGRGATTVLGERSRTESREPEVAGV